MGTKIEAESHSMDNCSLVNRCSAYHYYYGLAIDTTYYMWKVNRWAELVIVGKVCNHLRVNPLGNRVRQKTRKIHGGGYSIISDRFGAALTHSVAITG